ncbi:glycosyltransferase family 4 protein [Mongoliibacter ruber]|uniref:Glycosyltransferase involved in cell wall biosynthesis n=1 Tax=Mongoliibacter ruber TaxID=1750599 RepID=A0A2T0WG91_9BACT|nr:glycosyltransferase family 4 protein [Mongoliibacter ruber]PRY85730.1 glycosyltransferase involved in cell wall biosynthesis [Mongoliibacter ruber]
MSTKPNKRVLIITYYWPPSAGSGVQRWLKTAKYLPEFGWEPVIFTPENPDFALKDPSLLEEVSPQMEILKFPIWEPYGLFRSLKKNKLEQPEKILEKKDKSVTDRLGLWARANVLIPDPRIFWVKPSVNFLVDLIKKNQFQCIITTGPPHSMHLIGLQLKEKTGIPWIADFRDPWSKWEFLDTLPMTKWARSRHIRLEQKVLSKADEILTISPTFQKEFEDLSQRKIRLLTNGYDESDIPVDFFDKSNEKSETIEILYTGVIDAIRNPIPFLNAFRSVFELSEKKAILRFVGKVSEEVIQYVEADIWLKEKVVFEGYVSHKAVFDFYQKSHLLLLILTDTKNAKGNIPGKLFEYMATGRPVLALGDPKGDSAHILNESKAGQVYSHQDIKGIEEYLNAFAIPGRFQLSPSILKYSRKNLTADLSKLLDQHEYSFS